MALSATEMSGLIAEIEEQEKKLVFDRFSNADAWQIGCLLVEFAHKRSLPITIDITRGAQQLFHAALAGTARDNDEWINRKVATVRRFGMSSFLVGLSHAASGTPFDERSWNDPLVYAAHGGSFPVNITGTGMVGTITVSGLAQAEDHSLVVEAIAQFLATPDK